MTTHRIIILDPIAQEGLDILAIAKAAGIEHEVRTGLKDDALKKALTEFDGAICRSGVTISGDVLEGNKRLRAIARAGVDAPKVGRVCPHQGLRSLGATVPCRPGIGWRHPLCGS